MSIGIREAAAQWLAWLLWPHEPRNRSLLCEALLAGSEDGGLNGVYTVPASWVECLEIWKMQFSP